MHAFYSKIASFNDCENQVFFLKNLCFFKKKFQRFEKSYWFSRILRQICDNLVKNVNVIDKIEWKNVRVEQKIFITYYKYGGK